MGSQGAGEGRLLTEFQRGLQFDRLYSKRPRSVMPSVRTGGTLRLMTWNIGRGHDPERIADEIRRIGPDIVCLQEVDWNNQRTGSRDVLQVLVDRTNMLGLFGIEFLELQAPARARRLAGGGVTGNALLCRVAPTRSFRIELPPAVDWQRDAENRLLPLRVRRRLHCEPRIGGRFGLAAEFAFDDARLIVCSVHFEDKYGGSKARFGQFQSVCHAIESDAGSTGATAVIAGDFNTFDCARARLLVPDSDATALGRPRNTTEAEWWQRTLLPSTGFSDPFARAAWTFRVPLVFRAKLDWIAVGNASVHACGVGALASSDHRPIWVDIRRAVSPA
jgi:endonuclease/exonuclease/phosphatase family metal-dependent hydrolase